MHSAQIPKKQDEYNNMFCLNKKCPPGHNHKFMAVGALGHTHVWLLDKPIDIYAFRKTVYGCIQVWQLP